MAYSDHEIGGVIQEIEDQGKLENTLIIYIEGDKENRCRSHLICRRPSLQRSGAFLQCYPLV